MYRKKYVLLYGCLLGFLITCQTRKDIEVTVKFKRFDKAVFDENIASLLHNYPSFTPFYLENVINVGVPQDSLTASYLKLFTDNYRETVYDSLQMVFPNMEKVEKQLGKALGNYKSFFPTGSLPVFYTHFSGFNEPIIRWGNIISVSIENYMGKSSFYDKLGVYKYQRAGMYPDKIAVDIVKLLLLQKLAPQKATENLIATMIYQGKIMYALKKIFPEEELFFLFNYTEQQNTWCKENEAMMWFYIVEHKHLFTSDYRTIRNYIDAAPFTKGFPDESPGETGIWIGYQIVKGYMENTETKLPELFEIIDYEKILKESAYNPEN